MKKILVHCDKASAEIQNGLFDHEIQICQSGASRNLRLEVENISHWLLKNLEPICHDLLDIATFVYYADNSVPRGTEKDLYTDNWVRNFHFIIPVRELQIWQKPEILNTLIEMLGYLTEDKFNFTFVNRERTPEQLILKDFSESLPPAPESDCVALFSGGMDSLSGVIDLYENSKKPILISHQSRNTLAALQKKLAGEIRNRCEAWAFPHLGVTINRMSNIAKESSQRSRSFLYLALGSIIAHEMGFSELSIYENGITSFNLPRSGQTTGTQATRSTHPKVVDHFKTLASTIFNTNFEIITPFIWKTRTDVLDVLKRNNVQDLLLLSCSCAHSRRTKMYPHCGTCSQCVDRRFSMISSGLDSDDELNAYEKNIFTDDLVEGEERIQAINLLKFSLQIRRFEGIDLFLEHFGEAFDAIDYLPGSSDQVLESIYALHLRFANDIDEAMKSQFSQNWPRFIEGTLPENSLLAVSGKIDINLDDSIIKRADGLIQRIQSLPTGDGTAYEDLCEELFELLFCEGTNSDSVLEKPQKQVKSDQGYTRRDLIFENRAEVGFWKEVREVYSGTGIIIDAKNYQNEITGDIVREFATKYLKPHGLGRFGMLVARVLPDDVKVPNSQYERTSGAVEAQKNLWREDSHKMVLLLDQDDLIQMLEMKTKGHNPTDLLKTRIFTLKSRM